MNGDQLQEIVFFLLINSETIEDDRFNCKMSLLYYLFAYTSKRDNDENYADFAFELLNTILAQELPEIEKDDRRENIEIIGWSIMYFIRQGYFESDDLDDILHQFDKEAFRRVHTDSLPQTKFSPGNINKRILSILYLVYRIQFMSDSKIYSKIKDYLIKLIPDINRIKELNNVSKPMLKILFENLSGNSGIKDIPDGILDFIKQISDSRSIENSFLVNLKYKPEIALLQYMAYSKEIDGIKKEHENLTGILKNEIDLLINKLYKNKPKDSWSYIMKIAIYAMAILEDLQLHNDEFLAYMLVNIE